jgi:hypothetical protein
MFFQPKLDINETSQTGLICEQEAHKSDCVPSLNALVQAVDICGLVAFADRCSGTID